MKKLLSMLLVMTLLLTTAQSQGVDTIITNSKDVVMNALTDSGRLTAKIVYDDAKAGIIGLAKALKSPVEHVYYVLVKQQIVGAITDLIVLIIGFSFCMIAIKRFKSTEVWWVPEADAPTLVGILRCFQVGVGCIMVVVGLFSIDDIVAGFVNPEYGAIESIFEFIKK